MSIYSIIEGDKMRKKINNKMFLLTLVLLLIAIATIGYAKINNITLNINGTARATGIKSADDFKVKFVDVEVPENQPSHMTIDANLDSNDVTNRTASFTVTGMKGYGDTAVVKYTIANESNYFSANFNINVTCDSEYFEVEEITKDEEGNDTTTLAPGKNATITIKGKVIKVPTDSKKSADVTIEIQATSEPYTGE